MKYIVLFLIGGLIYGAVEVAYKGDCTHLSMFITGGLSFLAIGMMSPRIPLLLRMLLGSVLITVLEFLCGVIVNIWLGLSVWDYSDMPLNLMGQICLLFTAYWFVLTFVGIVLDRFLKRKLFGETLRINGELPAQSVPRLRPMRSQP